MKHKYTLEDIEFLKIHYPLGHWDKIKARFPNVSEGGIHHKCSRLGIKFDNKYRVKFNSELHYRKPWSDEEIEFLIKNYSTQPISKLLDHLHDRNTNSIQSKANSLNLVSYSKIKHSWTNEQIEYIKKNWILEPDKLMAQKMGKSFRAVKWKREELGLFRKDFESKSYTNLSKFLRGQNYEWKLLSMKECNYKCVLTGSKNFEIHHLYGVSNIINDVLNRNVKYKNVDFDSLTKDDLEFIREEFLKEQAKYPLGECVDKKLHCLFHSLYGQYYNTPEQWNRFKEDYKEGQYNKIA